MANLITLTTDFGAGSCYVAAMKGVVLAVNPDVQIVDLTHSVPPQNLAYTSFFLQAAVPYFPTNALHVVVVDPGVGSERSILYVEGESLRLLVPDNGCWTSLFDKPQRVIRLTEKRYWRDDVSNTFHGRDIFAPVAGHLSLGLDPALLGTETGEWQQLKLPQPVIMESSLAGEVIFIDDFGNLITNIPGREYLQWQSQPVRIVAGRHEVTARVRTYAEGAPGTAVALVSSMDTVEIAVNHGSAAQLLHATVGMRVQIELRPVG